MTAYVKPGTKERIGIVNDFVSPGLTDFIKRLIEEYNTIPWVDSKCGYACSDHTVRSAACLCAVSFKRLIQTDDRLGQRLA